jgi:SAM-dependent methyltransferase
MSDQLPPHLRLYDREYFSGGHSLSGYGDYRNCRGVLEQWGGMVEALARPESVLDVGCAYGYVVQYFRSLGIPAHGVEPSEYARSQVAPLLRGNVVAGALPWLPDSLNARYDTVLCTEVLEHLPFELVVPSLLNLADKTSRLLICLIMLDGHPTAHDDAGHLCLKDRDWWDSAFATTPLTPRPDLERVLSADVYSKAIGWDNRFFVLERM